MRRRATRYRGRARFVPYMPADVPDDQRWYWTESWQRGERRATRDIAKHQTQTFSDSDTLIRALVGPPFRPWKRAR